MLMPRLSELFRRVCVRSPRSAQWRKFRPHSIAQLATESLETRQLLTPVFVAMNGNDDSGDGSIENPYRTFQQAVNVADPGDEINFRQGNYDGGVTIHDPDITIKSHDGEWAKLTAPIDDQDIHQVVRFHFTADGGRISNIELEGGYYYAVKLETNWDWGVADHERNGAENITIENSKIHGSGRDAIKVTPGSDDLHVLNNEIYDTGMRYSGNAEGIDNVNGDRMIVRGNYIHEIATNGIYPKGGTIGSVIEDNLIMNTGNGGVQIGYYTDVEWFDTNANPDLYESIDTVVRNNIIVNTFGAGIGFWASQNAEVYNNTLVNVGEGQNAGVFFSYIDHYTSAYDFVRQSNINPTFVNNIVVQSETSPTQMVHLRNGSVEGPINIDNNIWFDRDGELYFGNRLVDPTSWRSDFSEWQADIGGANSVEADPLLDSAFHLTANSPAIDAAQILQALTSDYDGNVRSGLPDIGADEFNAGVSLAVLPPPGTVGTGSSGGVVLPAVHFNSTNYQVNEDGGTVTITVERSNDVSNAISVDYATVDLDANAGSDFIATSGTLNFAAGQTSASFTVPILDDADDEGQESFRVQLSNPTSGVILGAPSITTIDILDDDHVDVPGSLEFSSVNFDVAENAGVATVTVQRTGGSDGTVSADWSTANLTAIADADYTASSGTVTLGNGETSTSFSIPLLDDVIFEENETLQVSLSNPSGGATIGSRSLTTVTIVENETPPPSEFTMAASQLTVSEDAGTVNVVVNRTGDVSAPASVEVIARTVSDLAPAYGGLDHNFETTTLNFAADQASITLSVPIVNDDVAENDESFRLLLTSPSGDNTIGNDNATVITIQDDQTAIAVSSWQYIVNESDGSADVTVQRIGNASGTATVDYGAVNISAHAGSDFTATSGTLTFAPGETSHTVSVPIINDTAFESQEQFGFSLSNLTGDGELGRAWAYVVVNDDDVSLQPGMIQFSASEVTVDEAAGTVLIQVLRSEGSDGEVSVGYATANGSASAGADFTGTSGTLTFADGQAATTISVPILNDADSESSETFSLTLSNPTGGATLGTTDSIEITISDNDPLPVPGVLQFSVSNVTVDEDAGTATLVVNRTDGNQGAVSVDYQSQNGTATAGTDFNATSGTLTFADGETSKTLSVTLLDDTEFEGDETLTVVLSNATGGATLGIQNETTLTIAENEVSTPDFELVVPNSTSTDNPEVVSASVSENEGSFDFTVRRNGDSSGEDTVLLLVRNGGPDIHWSQRAYNGQDYTGADMLLTFAPGESEKTVSIPLIDDSYVESEEFFNVQLSQPSTGTELGDTTQAIVSVVDDQSVISVSTWQSFHDEGDGTAEIIVQRFGDLSGAATVDFSTINSAAVAGEDFVAESGTLSFAPGESEKSVSVDLLDDASTEGDEVFGFLLSNVSGSSTLGRTWQNVVIEDNDVATKPELNFSASDVSVNEDAGTLQVTVERTGDASQEVNVQYRTVDGDGSGDYSQTAWAGSDYGYLNETLTFAPGETVKTFEIPIINDTRIENSEHFRVQLFNQSSNAHLGDTAWLNVEILETETSIDFENWGQVTVNEESGTATIRVYRRGNVAGVSTVDFSTHDRSAVSGEDYEASSGTLIFEAGETFKDITINLIDDAFADGGEQKAVTLDNASGAALGARWGRITISDND